MIAINIEVLEEKKGRVTVLADEAPASLNITGADVDGLPDDYVLAAGSVLVTPSKNYIAFEDGVFTEKGSSGGGGGNDMLAIHIDGEGVMDKTFQQIYDALSADKFIILNTPDEQYVCSVAYITQTYTSGSNPVNYIVETSTEETYSTNSLDGYPAYYE